MSDCVYCGEFEQGTRRRCSDRAACDLRVARADVEFLLAAIEELVSCSGLLCTCAEPWLGVCRWHAALAGARAVVARVRGTPEPLLPGTSLVFGFQGKDDVK